MSDIRTVGVLGAGTMGNGIAHVFARAGFDVRLCEVEQRFHDRVEAGRGERCRLGVADATMAVDHIAGRQRGDVDVGTADPGRLRIGNDRGGRLTLADCALVPALFLIENVLPGLGLDDPIAANPNVAAYWTAIKQQEHAARILVELHRGLEERRDQEDDGIRTHSGLAVPE